MPRKAYIVIDTEKNEGTLSTDEKALLRMMTVTEIRELRDNINLMLDRLYDHSSQVNLPTTRGWRHHDDS